MKASGKLEAWILERSRIREDLANEFKYFEATGEFRQSALPAIIKQMRRYQKLGIILRAQDEKGTRKSRPKVSRKNAGTLSS